MAINKGYLESDKNESGDEMYTPYYAVEPLLEFIPKDKTIWCPFDEEWSAFYQTFKKHGYNVIRSCLKDNQDFFTHQPDGHYDVIVSNPPFSKKDKVLERVYKLNKPFALLLPVNSIQGKTRFKIFNNNVQILSFDSRIEYHNSKNINHVKKGSPFASAYFCK